jgi:glycosyltransferase involved in cell wall biosynthesis
MRMYNESLSLSSYSIESVLRQTYDDVRLLIYRDGGGQLPWLRLYADRYPEKIILVESDQNRGRAGALNATLKHLPEDADVVTWLDADGDQMAPGCVEYVMRLAAGISSDPFWFVRLCRWVIVPVLDKSSVEKVACFFEMATTGNYHQDEIAFLPGYVSYTPNLVGTVAGVFLPARFVRDVRIPEGAQLYDDAGLTWEIEKKAQLAGLWSPFGDGIGITSWQPLSALLFALEPLDYREKYGPGDDYFKLYGMYVPPKFNQEWYKEHIGRDR